VVIIPKFSAAFGRTAAALFVACFAGETTLLYRFQSLLAPLAVFPAGETLSVPVPVRAAEAMSVGDPATAGYRERAARTLDMARLGGPARVEARGPERFALIFEGSRRRFLAWRPWGIGSGMGPLVRIEMRPVGAERIELLARFVPESVLSSALFPIVGVLLHWPLGIAFWLVTSWGTWHGGRKEARRLLGVAAEEVRRRLAAFERPESSDAPKATGT
jgi:hypothetical protein